MTWAYWKARQLSPAPPVVACVTLDRSWVPSSYHHPYSSLKRSPQSLNAHRCEISVRVQVSALTIWRTCFVKMYWKMLKYHVLWSETSRSYRRRKYVCFLKITSRTSFTNLCYPLWSTVFTTVCIEMYVLVGPTALHNIIHEEKKFTQLSSICICN